VLVLGSLAEIIHVLTPQQLQSKSGDDAIKTKKAGAFPAFYLVAG
jgi:hypothetical protein